MLDNEWFTASASGNNGNCVQMRRWVKASASQGVSNCVEMTASADGIEVRDSKDPDGPVLRFNRAEFAAWLDGAKRGEFDELAEDDLTPV